MYLTFKNNLMIDQTSKQNATAFASTFYYFASAPTNTKK